MLSALAKLIPLLLLAVRPPVTANPKRPGATPTRPSLTARPPTTARPATPAATASAGGTGNAGEAVSRPRRCEDFLLKVYNAEVIPDRLLGGDGEMGGNPVSVRARVRLFAAADRILMETSLTLQERGGDRSTFSGVVGDRAIFDARKVAANCRIVGFSTLDESFNTVVHQPRHRRQSLPVGPNNKLIRRANCQVDGPGNDLGDVGCSVGVRAVRVRLRPQHDCKTEVVQIPERVLHPFLKHERGDDEMGGNPVQLEIHARVRATQTTMSVTTHGSMVEQRPDHTTVKESDFLEFYRVPAGCEISTVSEVEGHTAHRSARNDHTAHIHVGEGLLHRARCITDRKGKDHGRIGCPSITYRPFTVTLNTL